MGTDDLATNSYHKEIMKRNKHSTNYYVHEHDRYSAHS